MEDKRIIAHDMDGVPLTRDDLGFIEDIAQKIKNRNMEGNSAHGYSEGSEPIKLTVEEVLESTAGHPIDAMRQYAQQENVALQNQLKQRDETIQQLIKGLKGLNNLFYAGYTIRPDDINPLIELALSANPK